MMLAHRTQLHAVPDDLADEAAVRIEPPAGAIHAVRRAAIPHDATVLVVGAGTVGLLTVAAVRSLVPTARIIAVAKHGRQAATAEDLGATVVSSDEALGAVRRATGAFPLRPGPGLPFLLGGGPAPFPGVGARGAANPAPPAPRAGG